MLLKLPCNVHFCDYQDGIFQTLHIKNFPNSKKGNKLLSFQAIRENKMWQFCEVTLFNLVKLPSLTLFISVVKNPNVLIFPHV